MKKKIDRCYNDLGNLLGCLSEPVVAKIYCDFHAKHADALMTMPASAGRHHAWKGGYVTHIYEVTSNIVLMSDTFPGGHTRDQAILAAYVHDLDKLFWRYILDTEPPTPAQINYALGLGIRVAGETKTSISARIDAAKNKTVLDEGTIQYHKLNPKCPSMDDSAAVVTLMLEHNLPGWDVDIATAVSLHHGGWAPLAQSSSHVRMNKLAVLLHSADMLSASVQNGEANL